MHMSIAVKVFSARIHMFLQTLLIFLDTHSFVILSVRLLVNFNKLRFPQKQFITESWHYQQKNTAGTVLFIQRIKDEEFRQFTYNLRMLYELASRIRNEFIVLFGIRARSLHTCEFFQYTCHVDHVYFNRIDFFLVKNLCHIVFL